MVNKIIPQQYPGYPGTRPPKGWVPPLGQYLNLLGVYDNESGYWMGLPLQVLSEQLALADDPMPNDPIGVARGIHPGRVVWVHEPDATDWDGPDMGDGHWWESGNTNMAAVDRMMRRSMQALAGESSGAEAWDKIFRHFNQTQGKGDVGYQVGEKITIKVNLVGCLGIYGSYAVDPETYELVRVKDYMNTSPQMMLALLRQLVNIVGVDQADISIGDTLCYFPNQYYDICHNEFPNVHYLDYEGKFGRTLVQPSSTPIFWSNHPTGVFQDYVPESYARAEYIINMANFKSHDTAAVTLCAKNHYGSLIRGPVQEGYYNLHSDRPYQTPGMGHYRNLVDLMGHAHIGGKTVLYIIDGLYAGNHMEFEWPTRLNQAPFNGDWSSSLFVSQDPVAIDSVAFDFLWSEPGWGGTTRMSGGEDYLHEAALADNPPSGTFYDPDNNGDVARLASLGVHEHWNNPIDKQYSRNLGTGEGIELVSFGPGQGAPTPDVKANGLDGPIELSPADTLSVTMELSPGDYADYSVDWWCLADAPMGWHYRDSVGWKPGVAVTYQGDLFKLPEYEVLNTSGLPAGEYTFYFGVDGNANGIIDDPLYYDKVVVYIIP